VPIIQDSNYVFKPTLEDIVKAQKLFIPSHGNEITFLKSALYDEDLPQYDLPEVNKMKPSSLHWAYWD